MPAPTAFVLSGGASLGAIQAGMLQALAEAGLEPDLVVGTSVGSLNGAVVAEEAELEAAASRLVGVWRRLRRRDVLPERVVGQLWAALHASHLHSPRGLRALLLRTLRARRFDELARPLVVVAGETLTGHVARLSEGDLVRALLAATALPGIFPPVVIDGVPHWDAGSVANVPLRAALARGARSVVVLDAGNVCHLDRPPERVADAVVHAMTTAMRQRVRVEAPLVARQVPLAYLPRPCAEDRSLLAFDRSSELIEPARELVSEFLRDTRPPTAGAMAGEPHDHGEADERLGALAAP